MISTKCIVTTVSETDEEKRDKLVDKLTEEDAKFLLKQFLIAMQGNEDKNLDYVLNEILSEN